LYFGILSFCRLIKGVEVNVADYNSNRHSKIEKRHLS
jgi:hypothetical protein